MSLRFDDFELDLDRFELRRGGESVALEPQAFEVLAHLVTHRDRVVPKNELLEAVWESQFVSDSALTTRVKEVRRALGDDGQTQRYVRTVRGRGYHFVAEAVEGEREASAASNDEAEAAPPGSTAPIAVPLPTDSFVGRTEELGTLRAAVDSAIDGRGRVVLLAGEAGIGKTRTSQELAEYAISRGARVFWGRVRQASGAPPYYPWAQIISTYLTSSPSAHGDATALDDGGTELLAELTGQTPASAGSSASAAGSAQFHLFEAVSAWLRHASTQQPLMLVLEDLHWAGEPTLALLAHLVPDVLSMRLLVVATLRDSELGTTEALTPVLAELSRASNVTRVHLDGLSATEIEHYVHRYPTVELAPALVRSVHDRTDGNPFFVSQIVELIGRGGAAVDSDSGEPPGAALPVEVRDVLTARLDLLSAAARAALRVGAISGRVFDLETVATVLERDHDTVIDDLEEARGARILEDFDQAGRYRFVHALMQEALLAELSAARRAQIHGTVGTALEASYGTEASAEAARLSAHYAESAPVQPTHRRAAAHYSALAAQQAEASHAWSDAVRFYERALSFEEADPETDAAVIRLALGRCQIYHHLPRPAWRNLLTALDDFRNRGDWELAAEAVLVASDILASPERLSRLLSSVLDGSGDALPETMRAELTLRRALMRARVGEPSAEWQSDLNAAATVIESRDDPRLAGKLARVRAEVPGGPPQGSGPVDLYLEAAHHLDRAGDAESASNAMWLAVNEPKRHGELDELDATLATFLEYVRRHRLRRWAHMGQYLSTRVALLHGDRARAQELLRSDMPETSHLTAVARASLAELEPWPPTNLEPLLATPALAGGDLFQTAVAVASRLRLHTLLGDSAAALEDETALWELVTTGEMSAAAPAVFLIAGDIAAELDSDSFVEWCASWLDASPTTRTGDTGSSENIRGRLALRLGDLEVARTQLEAGLARAEAAEWPVDIGRLHQALAELTTRLGDTDGAARHRAEAMAQFRNVGAAVFVQQLEATES